MDDYKKSLLQGAIDMHLHCDPSFMNRWEDAVGFSNLASAAGMRALCIKDHHLCTVQSAYFANKYRNPSDTPFDCFGSLCLNNSAGGFQPLVVEMNLRFGCKQIYLPTVSAEGQHPANHPGKTGKSAGSFLPTKKEPPLEKPLSIYDENGDVCQALLDIFALIRDYDAILCTGHLNYEDSYAAVKAAAAIGVKKIVLTHFDAVRVKATLDNRLRSFDELGEVQKAGNCYVEYCMSQKLGGGPVGGIKHISQEYRDAEIKYFGPDKVVMGTDAGSLKFPSLIDNWGLLLDDLISFGWDEASIRKMCGGNQRELLNIND